MKGKILRENFEGKILDSWLRFFILDPAKILKIQINQVKHSQLAATGGVL